MNFDLGAPLPTTRTVIEASAGTGKTYTLTSLITRYIAEGRATVDQLLVVTFTRAAANELRERTRSMLRRAIDVVDADEAPPAHPWMQTLLIGGDTLFDTSIRRQRLADAVARFDEMTITTIHGFCQQALLQLGVRAGVDPQARLIENTNELIAEVARDLLIVELADDPQRLSPAVTGSGSAKTPAQVERELVAAMRTVLNNPAATLTPDPVDAPVADPIANRWAELTRDAVSEVRARLERRGEMGYDELIGGVQRALADPLTGPAVAAQLGQRYPVVLVDEFQDTDRTQWEVFSSAFATSALITVGDPKQAIYRFRGADVHAYLDAAAATEPASLGVNHRSDGLLLAGLERIFDGATLGDARIRFTPVAAAPTAPATAMNIGAPIQLRVAPIDPRLQAPGATADKPLAMPKARALILDDLVGRVIDLLDEATITVNGVSRPVEPGDIAVLTPTHLEADHVAAALRRAAIPSVRTRTGSVLQSAAVMQWRMLLSALCRPDHVPAVNAAALGWFLRTDPVRLTGEDQAEVRAGLHERVAAMAASMRRLGLAAFYDSLKSSTPMLEVVLGQPGGERDLTDADHVAELLAAAMHGLNCEPVHVLRVLEDLVTADDEFGEETMRRIDSDALAVQVTTIHAAKGLEFPIVLVPFAFKGRPPARTPNTYTDNGRRMIDVASIASWIDADGQDQTARKNLAQRDIDGDGLRLLYVALTRAQHRVEIWWAAVRSANTSPLARVLFDRAGADPVRNSAKAPSVTPASTASILAALAAASPDSIEVVELPATAPTRSWAGRDAGEARELAIADAAVALPDPSWSTWSFSRLHALATANEQLAEPAIHAESPLDRGGADEPVEPNDAVAATEASTTTVDGGAATDTSAPLANMPGGTRVGTLVHSVLEALDFTSDDLRERIRDAVAEHAHREAIALPVEDVADGLTLALRTPLGDLFDDRRLVDIARGDRLDELTFDLPIGDGARGTVSAATIGEALQSALHSDDPFLPWAQQLVGDLTDIDIAGWLYGSIDAVIRVRGSNGDDRFVVVDYKTNRLHGWDDADVLASYDHPSMVEAMIDHRYPLQALLYSVAVHRFLRWRLGEGYDPERHLGGVAYLFVRGMAGGSDRGVFRWRPSSAAILAVDAILAEAGSR